MHNAADISWNLTMAVVWIATRDKQLVNHFAEVPLASLRYIDDDLAEVPSLAPSFPNHVVAARADLRNALDAGQLVASAVDAAGLPVFIESRLWAGLDVREHYPQDFEHADLMGLSIGVGPHLYRHVHLRARDVLEIWPPRSAQDDPLMQLVSTSTRETSSNPQTQKHSNVLVVTVPGKDAANAEMKADLSPADAEELQHTPGECQIRDLVAELTDDGKYPHRTTHRIRAIQNLAETKGLLPPGDRSIKRYFSKLKTARLADLEGAK